MICLLIKTSDGEVVSAGEEMSKILNEYILTVFTQEKMQEMPDSERICGADENKMEGISIIKTVEQIIDRTKMRRLIMLNLGKISLQANLDKLNE